MKYKYLTLKPLQELFSKTSCKMIGAILMCFLSLNTIAQSYTTDNVYVHEDGEMVAFGAHTFDGTNVVETARTNNRGYFSFGTAASWTAAADASHVDGYARQYVNGAFVLPIGDNGAYRPIATTAGPTDAAYYAVNPNGSYSVTSTASDVSDVSTVEYWDIDGAVATSITLTWNSTSDIATITGSDLTKLIMVGWDGSEWVKIPATVSANTLDATASTPAFTGSAGTLTAGSITTDATITPNTYEAYTFAKEDGEVCLAATAFLQGALYNSTNAIMTDNLRSNSLIPTSEPYAAMTNFTHVGNGGGETTTAGVLSTTGNDAIVDWVFIELRDATNSATVVETQSALIQRDGNIVDASDGTSNVCFSGLASNNVFVAVRHRNHLGVMANAAVTLTSAGTAVDFSTTTLHGTNAAGLGEKSNGSANTVVGLWLGNTSLDDKIIYSGPNNDVVGINNAVINAPGNLFKFSTYAYAAYHNGDIDMDGSVIYSGPNNDVSPVNNVVINHPGNIFNFPTRAIDEQLP